MSDIVELSPATGKAMCNIESQTLAAGQHEARRCLKRRQRLHFPYEGVYTVQIAATVNCSYYDYLANKRP